MEESGKNLDESGEGLDLPDKPMKFREIFRAIYDANGEHLPFYMDPKLIIGIIPSEVFDVDAGYDNARYVIDKLIDVKERLRIMMAREGGYGFLGSKYEIFLRRLLVDLRLAKSFDLEIPILQLNFVESVIEHLEEFFN